MTRVIVTRPLREGQAWLHALQARSWDAHALPLIDLDAAPDQAPLTSAWQALQNTATSYQALMFVSSAAVEGFWAARPASAPSLLANGDGNGTGSVRCWATGPGTRRALLAAGVAPEHIDAPPTEAGQFDSEALWHVVSSGLRSDARVLIVRGDDALPGSADVSGSLGAGAGRDWLAQQLRAAQVEVDFVVSYIRALPTLSPAQLALARQAATDGSVWLFSSSQALQNLRQILPGQDWSMARAVASHPRIEKAARQTGFGAVKLARPVLNELMASIESFA